MFSSKLLWANWKIMVTALVSDWSRHFFTSPLKPLKGIQRNLTGSKILTFSTMFVFFGLIGKKKMATPASDLLRQVRILPRNR